MVLASGSLAAFYLLRWIAFMVKSHDGQTFTTVFGSAVTALVTMVLLVVVSTSMSALSSVQQTRTLRVVATNDNLTNLLNRKAFLDLAAEHFADHTATPGTGTLIMAALDQFKAITDTHGHDAGNNALRGFADACLARLHLTDLIGRYGGVEFIRLPPGSSPAQAETVAAEISKTANTRGHRPQPDTPSDSGQDSPVALVAVMRLPTSRETKHRQSNTDLALVIWDCPLFC
jgi:diguanylate cyclase (GGDEF)-like protein